MAIKLMATVSEYFHTDTQRFFPGMKVDVREIKDSGGDVDRLEELGVFTVEEVGEIEEPESEPEQEPEFEPEPESEPMSDPEPESEF